jgi:hypothetical protein
MSKKYKKMDEQKINLINDLSTDTHFNELIDMYKIFVNYQQDDKDLGTNIKNNIVERFKVILDEFCNKYSSQIKIENN